MLPSKFVFANEHDDDDEKKISNKSLKLSEKCQLRLSSSFPSSFFFFFRSLLVALFPLHLHHLWTEKAILKQILDIPCRSILIRSSKIFRCGLFALVWCLRRCALIHTWWLSNRCTEKRGDETLDEGTNAKRKTFPAVDWSLISSSSSLPFNIAFISFQFSTTESQRYDSLNESAMHWGKWKNFPIYHAATGLIH